MGLQRRTIMLATLNLTRITSIVLYCIGRIRVRRIVQMSIFILYNNNRTSPTKSEVRPSMATRMGDWIHIDSGKYHIYITITRILGAAMQLAQLLEYKNH